jgi:Na+:H+ antiporter, NhaA family
VLGSLVSSSIKADWTHMYEKIITLAGKLHPARLSELASYLLRDEAISGKLILGATVMALIAANSPLGTTYTHLWHTHLSIGLGNWLLAKDLQEWVSEGLMAFFFLVVGLELKRELVGGELRKFKTAALPFAAAIGGMIVPALIYMLINTGRESFQGWAIPMATDIAFAVGILAFVGKSIPASVRLFLLTLAIVDDIGAVIVIAIFYSVGINLWMLAVVAALSGVVVFLAAKRRLAMPIFVLIAALLWLAINASGVHASITGALIGLLAPVAATGKHSESIAIRLERFSIPLSTLIVVPLFAFANTGIAFSSVHFAGGAAPVICGIIVGLVAGKVLGILGASWLVVKLKLADLPTDASWSHIVGVGMLAGIGFTVSIFVTELAFNDQQLINISKLSVFIASAISGILGLLALKARRQGTHGGAP